MQNHQIKDTIMEKKIFEAPYLKVVEVKNDVIATSLGDSTMGGSVYNDGTDTDNDGYNDNMF